MVQSTRRPSYPNRKMVCARWPPESSNSVYITFRTGLWHSNLPNSSASIIVPILRQEGVYLGTDNRCHNKRREQNFLYISNMAVTVPGAYLSRPS